MQVEVKTNVYIVLEKLSVLKVYAIFIVRLEMHEFV